jgi:hypothetical protein
MIILLFEHWAASYLKSDKYLRGLAVGVLEVLVHSVAFWARLKQSSVITKLLLKVQDFEESGLQKDKAVKVINSLNKEKHSEIPSPLDPMRFERRNQVNDWG